ncbi:hypothetical protein [Bartonella harrusi]|uniref:Uncharacterized protein n=1 Tax=Bartonella harrusi TaxID=2961895 RepID=A0ABY5EVC2_9HYPH|nr:hypothetical protein [Bartonella harrusi]UTO27788.1 hypothetical protein NMK50_05925 [Bartonella harrusi]
MKIFRKMPTEHERVSETSAKITPVLQGGKLEREVRKNNKKSNFSSF